LRPSPIEKDGLPSRANSKHNKEMDLVLSMIRKGIFFMRDFFSKINMRDGEELKFIEANFEKAAMTDTEH